MEPAAQNSSPVPKNDKIALTETERLLLLQGLPRKTEGRYESFESKGRQVMISFRAEEEGSTVKGGSWAISIHRLSSQPDGSTLQQIEGATLDARGKFVRGFSIVGVSRPEAPDRIEIKEQKDLSPATVLPIVDEVLTERKSQNSRKRLKVASLPPLPRGFA